MSFPRHTRRPWTGTCGLSNGHLPGRISVPESSTQYSHHRSDAQGGRNHDREIWEGLEEG